MFWDYLIAASYLWLGFLSKDWFFKKELMAAELYSLEEIEGLLFEFLLSLMLAKLFLTILPVIFWVSITVEIGSLNGSGSNNPVVCPGNLVENYCLFCTLCWTLLALILKSSFESTD